MNEPPIELKTNEVKERNTGKNEKATKILEEIKMQENEEITR